MSAQINDGHCCKEMALHIESGEVAIVYTERYREYGIDYRPGTGGGFQQIHFCPWCGTKLPKSLVDEWFAILDDELGLEPDDPALPEEMKTSAWWRIRGLY
jgi:hypothetical protein